MDENHKDKVRLLLALLTSAVAHLSIVFLPLGNISSSLIHIQTGNATNLNTIQVTFPNAGFTISHSSIRAETLIKTSMNSARPIVDDIAWPVKVAPKILWVNELDMNQIENQAEGGYVEIEILVGSDGTPLRLLGAKSNLPTIFENMTIDAFMSARFSPGTINGHAVPQATSIRVNFEVTDPVDSLLLGKFMARPGSLDQPNLATP